MSIRQDQDRIPSQDEYRSELGNAVEANDLEYLTALLGMVRLAYPGAFATQSTGEDGTVLHRAAGAKCLPVIFKQLLLPENRRYVGMPRDRTFDGKTVLHFTTKNMSVEVAAMLLENGADVNARDWFNETPLHYAVCNGTDFNARGSPKQIIPESAVLEMVSLLLDNHAAINAVNLENDTALYGAVFTGNVKVVHMLLERGADISIEGPGRPITHHAIRGGQGLSDSMQNIEMLEIVLENGADINKLDVHKRSVLQHAVFMNNRYAARLMEHLLLEMDFQTERFSQLNMERCYEAVMMARVERLGIKSIIQTLPLEISMLVIESVKHDIPKNMASASLHALKANFGHLPILDTDHHVSDFQLLSRKIEFESNVESIYRLKDRFVRWYNQRSWLARHHNELL
jgi:ankyrin repeat protein